MAIGTYISIITLNVNQLNIHFTSRDTYKLKVRGWKKIFHANGHQNKAGVAILLSDKTDFKMKNILRDKERHYVMIKGSIQEEDIMILNIYALNIGSLQYINQLLTTLKGEINNNTIIVGEFNTPLTAMDRSSRQKINKETQALNEVLDQMDLINIYRTFHPKATEYAFSSNILADSPENHILLCNSIRKVTDKISLEGHSVIV
uniref:Endonuclease/exonuclease/phosphatase domain-containing protein n=1 Tax=Catagonus wagneri TaxID=51154 RepID=A0A8C3X4E0_9CETA